MFVPSAPCWVWKIKNSKRQNQPCIKVTQRGLVTWLIVCSEPSQPLGIISGLKETFIKRHIVERTNKAEIRPEKLSEKTETCRENLWNEIQLKGP